MNTGPRIALIHATSVAIEPILQAFGELWPDAEPVNILDDSLSVDRAKSDDLTPALHQRIHTLAEYGCSLGAEAVLFTCSAFGPAIEAAAKAVLVPVLKPNEAMFEEALVAREAGSFADIDALMLAQFSTSRALKACREATSVPVLSSPEAAVRKVRRLLGA